MNFNERVITKTREFTRKAKEFAGDVGEATTSILRKSAPYMGLLALACGPLMALIPSIDAAGAGVVKQPPPEDGCLGFYDVANIEYESAVWNADNGRYESKFKQLSNPGEEGYVEEVQYLAGGTIVVFPLGANVTGYSDSTTKGPTIHIAEGWDITPEITCYQPK